MIRRSPSLRSALPAIAAAIAAGVAAPVAAQLSLERRAWSALEAAHVAAHADDAWIDRFDAPRFVDERGAGLRLATDVTMPGWGEGHRLRLTHLASPLDATAGLSAFGRPVPAMLPASLRPDPDAWRATYSVPMFGRADPGTGWALRVGGTLAGRDGQARALRAAASPGLDAIGTVPLMHLSASRALSRRWLLEGELDASPLAGGLLDGAARVRWAYSPGLSFAAGLRHLRGADADEAYGAGASTSLTFSARYAF